jgi:hypothetical protein
MHKKQTFAEFLLTYSFLVVGLSFLLNRYLMVRLPQYDTMVATQPLLNTICGLLSDLTLLFFFWFVTANIRAIKQPLIKLNLSILTTLVAIINCILLAAHFKYVEFYGVNLRLFHLDLLGHTDSWKAGTTMISGSWKSLTFLVVPVMGLIIARKKLIKLAPIPWGRSVTFAVLFAVLTNTLVIEIRKNRQVNPELRYNPYASLLFETQRAVGSKLVRPFKPEDRAIVDKYLGQRDWNEDLRNNNYLLFQSSVWQGAQKEPNPLEAKLKNHIQEMKKRNGPPNVLFVMTESFRSHELWDLMKSENPQMVPGYKALAADGVTFTNVLSTGQSTSYGQEALLCGLYSPPGYSLMVRLPLAKVVCLQDMFASQGYNISFLAGSDNNFNNREQFYRYHMVPTLISELDFDPKQPKGWWGYSDDALLSKTVDVLKQSQKPFFSTVLMLSSHLPHQLPQDAPASIDRNLGIYEQMVQYLDWAMQRFYKRMAEELPNTILVVTGDHGFVDHKAPQGDPTFEDFRRNSGVPLFIVAPGLPTDVKGQKVETLVANIDFPNTLLSLLDMEDMPNQFMGVNAFRRTEPFQMSWFSETYTVGADAAPQPPKTPTELIEVFASLLYHNKYMPDAAQAVLGQKTHVN